MSTIIRLGYGKFFLCGCQAQIGTSQCLDLKATFNQILQACFLDLKTSAGMFGDFSKNKNYWQILKKNLKLCQLSQKTTKY